MSQRLGGDEEVKGFLTTKIVFEYKRLNLPYFIRSQALVKPPDGELAYLPDILLLNRPNLVNERLWEKESTVILGASIPLVIEVFSTNWRVDYLTKVKDYEEIPIPEYWIPDYLGLGGRQFIGSPKQPTIFIHELVEGECQVSQFRGDDRIISPTFSELSLTANQIF